MSNFPKWIFQKKEPLKSYQDNLILPAHNPHFHLHQDKSKANEAQIHLGIQINTSCLLLLVYSLFPINVTAVTLVWVTLGRSVFGLETRGGVLQPKHYSES